MSQELEPFCFWCGGNARWDFVGEPRPFHPNTLQFCQNCATARQDGEVLLFEMTETNPGCGNPTLTGREVYYTGRWVAVPVEVLNHLFPPAMVPGVIETGFACLKDENYHKAEFDKYPWRTIQ